MELLALGEDLLQECVLPHVPYKAVARLACSCSVMRSIVRRISGQPFVRSHLEKGRSDGHAPLPAASLTISELKFVLGKLSIDVSALEEEAGSDESLLSVLVERLESACDESIKQPCPLQDVARARALLGRLSMPARPDLCFIFASEAQIGVAELLAELLPRSCVVFGAVASRGVIGTARGAVSEADSDAQPLIAVSLVHLAGTRVYPFFHQAVDPHARQAAACPEVALALERAREAGQGGAGSSTLLLLADGADSVMGGGGLIEQLQGSGIPALGGLVDKDAVGTLLLRAQARPGLRDGLRRCSGAVGLFLEGAHSAVPAITRGASLISDDEWVVTEAQSSSRAICPGHSVSQHIVKQLARHLGGSDRPRTTTPLQALYELSAQHGGSLPAPLYLAMRPDRSEARHRLVHPVHVLHRTGALEVDSAVEVGELCSFGSVHAQGSADELAACARAARGRLGAEGPLLCLSFVCCGRGGRFHAAADRETAPLREAFPHATFSGFFAAGELGPRPYSEAGSDREDVAALMGFTAVHALLRFHAA